MSDIREKSSPKESLDHTKEATVRDVEDPEGRHRHLGYDVTTAATDTQLSRQLKSRHIAVSCNPSLHIPSLLTLKIDDQHCT